MKQESDGIAYQMLTIIVIISKNKYLVIYVQLFVIYNILKYG